MKVLITGSSGFIGRFLVNYLKKRKITVFTYDLADGQDLFNKKALEEAVKKVNYIVHLAAVGDVYQAEKDPQNALKVGINGTQSLIEAANKHKIKKIVYVSTWEVYGKPIYQPIDEKHPCNPTHPYAISKYGGELIIKSTFNKIPWLILRLGTVYGFNMRSSSVFSLFIKKTKDNKPLVIHGKGDQFRQFTHIQDISEAIYLSLSNKIKNETLNIINQKVVTILQLATLIKKSSGNNHLKIITIKPRTGDVFSSIISNNKSKLLLNWKPKVNLEKALKQIIRH